MTKTRVTRAVFPVAGPGTRFLPATKSIPKEILTLVDRPLIDYAFQEACDAGILEFIFVTSRGKSALGDYFDDAPLLEQSLAASGKWDLLEALQSTNVPSGNIAYVRQAQPKGLGHAVLCAKKFLPDDEPFAVLLPDDVIYGPTGALRQMVDAHQEFGGSIVAAMEVSPGEVSSYGVIDPVGSVGRLTRARGLVEKPTPEEAPSNLAIVGRYILAPTVLETLSRQEPGAGGEIQLTDALDAEIAAGRTVSGFKFEGERFDCGSKLGYLEATLTLALRRRDLGPNLKARLAHILHCAEAAE
jgi:UTP--glucose-1-phosphate uridylyltransferase